MKALKLLAIILAALTMLVSASTFTLADPAVYKDGELFIGEGIIVQESGDLYFGDVSFEAKPDGSFRFKRGEIRSLAMIDKVSLDVEEAILGMVEVTLNISGYLSVPCVELEPVAISLVEDTFHIVLAETTLGPAETCIQVLEPFEKTLSLDVSDFAPGTYTVLVNNSPYEFTIED